MRKFNASSAFPVRLQLLETISLAESLHRIFTKATKQRAWQLRRPGCITAHFQGVFDLPVQMCFPRNKAHNNCVVDAVLEEGPF
jgi:hypothetical protein